MKPMKPVALDLSKLAHDKLKIKKYQASGNETKKVGMTYDKVALKIQTPLAEVPFGLTISEETEPDPANPRKKRPVANSKKPKKYSLDCQFDKISPELNELKKVMQIMDEKNINYIASQSAEWWPQDCKGGKLMTPEMVSVLYDSIIKVDNKGEYPERFRIKLPLFEGVPQFKVYDQHNKLIEWCKIEEGKKPELDWSWAQKHMKVDAIIECEGLVILESKKVYCTFKVVQLRVRPSDALEECAFDDTPLTDLTITEKTKEKTKETEKDDLKVEDEEEDEEGEEEDDQ